MFQIQFLRTYKDGKKKADSSVIYSKDIQTEPEVLPPKVVEATVNIAEHRFSPQEIASIKSDLNAVKGGSVFYFMTKVYGFISAEKLIDIIYNNLEKSPEDIKQIFKENFVAGRKIRPQDEDMVTTFIQAATKYFQKNRKNK
jgi:hypothetical protein